MHRLQMKASLVTSIYSLLDTLQPFNLTCNTKDRKSENIEAKLYSGSDAKKFNSFLAM